MSEEKEVYEVAVKPTVPMGTLQVAPELVIATGTRIANELKQVVIRQKLFSNISGKNYVRVEGWNTLGALMGILPREEYVKEIDNGYEAKVQLIRTSDGVVIGGASAICTREEKNWITRDAYAVRSMAITRATGKAFRLGFSWIMKLAGFQVTPLEEMPAEVVETDVVESGNGEEDEKPTGKSWPEYMVSALVEEELAQHPKNAVNILNLFPDLPRNTSKEKVILLAQIYRARRDDNGLSANDAAEVAWKEWE